MKILNPVKSCGRAPAGIFIIALQTSGCRPRPLHQLEFLPRAQQKVEDGANLLQHLRSWFHLRKCTATAPASVVLLQSHCSCFLCFATTPTYFHSLLVLALLLFHFVSTTTSTTFY
mmetsp:Transcript_26337/g.66434  ORF Transcript_26337/g.66434 Transcript_26337/m.66434 type:complete len:116 (+) Transcript_26337:379-726(+)